MLYFYLIPETSVRTSFGNNGTKNGMDIEKEKRQNNRKTTDEKVAHLSQYLNNVDGLVKDLREFKPFGDFYLD